MFNHRFRTTNTHLSGNDYYSFDDENFPYHALVKHIHLFNYGGGILRIKNEKYLTEPIDSY